MNLLAIRYFCAIANHGSITVTAQSLHISQPALSKMLRNLEQELNTQLFDRNSNGLRLTENGAAFYRKASTALELLDEGIREAQLGSSFSDHKVRVLSAINSSLLPHFYLVFQQSYPDIQLEIKRIHPADLGKETHYDFCFIPATWQPAKGVSIPLFSEEFFLAVPTFHPLAAQESVNLADTADFDYITLETGVAAYHYFQALCQIAQFRPKISVKCDSLSTLQTFLEAGKGIALVPRHSPLATSEKIKFIKITEPDCKRSIMLYWPSSDKLNAASIIFRDFCRDFFVSLENSGITNT